MFSTSLFTKRSQKLSKKPEVEFQVNKYTGSYRDGSDNTDAVCQAKIYSFIIEINSPKYVSVVKIKMIPIFNENVFGLEMACVRDQAKSYHAIFFARLATNFR